MGPGRTKLHSDTVWPREVRAPLTLEPGLPCLELRKPHSCTESRVGWRVLQLKILDFLLIRLWDLID